jgi:hypothetical protein
VGLQSRFTVGEDAADAGGLGQAFSAWKTQFDSDKSGEKYPNYKLPGLNYTRWVVDLLGDSSGRFRSPTESNSSSSRSLEVGFEVSNQQKPSVESE